MILVYGFEIINTTPITRIKWSLENVQISDENILNKLDEIEYGFSYLRKSLYDLNKRYFTEKKTFLIYHIDTDPPPMNNYTI